jgi:hypothetical protein
VRSSQKVGGRRRGLLLPACIAAVSIAAAVASVWVMWQRPFDVYPTLSSQALVQLARDQGLVCQPPDKGEAAVHWSCSAMEGSTPRNLEWLDRSTHIQAIDASIGPPVERGQAASWLGLIATLVLPSDRRDEVKSWIRDNPSGQMSLGQVDLATDSSGGAYTVTVDIH